MDKSTLVSLANSYCDGQLTPVQISELDKALSVDPEACRLFLEYCQLHGDLRFITSEDQAVDRFWKTFDMQVAADVQRKGTQEGRYHVLARAFTTVFAPESRRRMIWNTATIAAGILVVIGLIYTLLDAPLEAERHAQIVGRLTDTMTATWAPESSRFADAPLLAGTRLDLLEGTACLSMTSGAECVLQGPAVVVLESNERVALKQGKLTAKVAPWNTGFTVDTSAMQVIDLGTSFSVSVEGSTVEASVLEGNVRVRPTSVLESGRSSLLVSKGEAVRYDSAERKLIYPVIEASAPLKLADSRISVAPFHPVAIFNTGAGLSLGDEDPNWRIVSGSPTPDFREGQYAVVCELDERYLANAPQDSQWISVSANLPPCEYNAVYTFETEFDLTGFDLSTVVIVGQILADNGVQEVRINGVPISFTPWIDNNLNQLFHRFHRIEIKDGFVAGKNTIQIDVFNAVIPWHQTINKPEANPMSLRVEWQAFGRKANRPVNDSA